MGLFYTEAGNAARTSSTAAAARTTFTEADKRTLGCASCPLDKAALHSPKMFPEGSKTPLVYVLGETPTQIDDKQGTHFGSASGAFLRDRVPEGIDAQLRWNYVLRCAAGNNHQALVVECCRKLQVADIEQTKPPVILAVGKLALHWLMGTDKQVHIWRGRRAPVAVGRHVCWAYFVDDPAEIMQKMGNRKYGPANVAAFERDLQRVFGDIERGLPEACVESPSDYHKGIELLQTYGADGLARIEQVLAELADVEHAHDIETDRLHPYGAPDARILSVAVGTYDRTVAYAWEHPEARWSAREHKQLAEMHYAYLMGSGLKWAHAAKFEQQWWHDRYGPAVVFDTSWGDTLGQAHVIDERGGDEDKAKAKGLGELTQLHLGFNVKALSPVDRKKLASTPLHYVLPYNALDTKYTHVLSVIQAAIIEEQGLSSVYELLNSFTPSIVTMQAVGVVRNEPVIKQLDDEMSGKIEVVKAKIFADRDVIAFRNSGRKFEPTSNPDLIIFFRDFLRITPERRGKRGDDKYSVDDDALSKIKHPVAGWIAELRTVQKLHGYVTPLKPGGKHVAPDGRAHGSYSQYVTASGRLSCKEPNQTNYPRRGKEAKVVRRIISCPRGHRFYAFDYGQLEWRVGAGLSRDKQMIRELHAGADIHGRWTDALGTAFAPRMLRENRKGLRDALKNDWTFSNLYGNTPPAIAYMLGKIFGIDLREDMLMPHYEEFWATYPELRKYQDELLTKYWAEGYVETGTHQRRREPLARNELINHPFQGTGGHIVVDAQARISRFAYERERPSLQPIMNIHDDLSFYFPDHTAEQDIEDVARMMLVGSFDRLDVRLEGLNDVPMLVECSVGENWADKEEIGAFITKDFT